MDTEEHLRQIWIKLSKHQIFTIPDIEKKEQDWKGGGGESNDLDSFV